jgi:hypothetical protein
MGNVVAIVVRAFVNNMSNARQYPTYWGFGVSDTLRIIGHKKDV